MIPPCAANVSGVNILSSGNNIDAVLVFTLPVGSVFVIGCTMLILESLDAGFTVFMDTGTSSCEVSTSAGRGTVTFNPSCISLTSSPKALTIKVFTAFDTISCWLSTYGFNSSFANSGSEKDF